MTQYISGAHAAISPNDSIGRLRELFNEAADVPVNEREMWLMRNVSDADERQAVAALLQAYDGDEAIDLSEY